MTVFQFPESTFNFDLTPFGKQNQTLDDISFNTENNEEYIEKSDFTVHLEEFLDSLIKKNIQFELPPKIEVRYYDYNDFDVFKDKLKDFGKKITNKLPFSIGFLRKDFLSVESVKPRTSGRG